jgi:hypothetical protein
MAQCADSCEPWILAVGGAALFSAGSVRLQVQAIGAG